MMMIDSYSQLTTTYTHTRSTVQLLSLFRPQQLIGTTGRFNYLWFRFQVTSGLLLAQKNVKILSSGRCRVFQLLMIQKTSTALFAVELNCEAFFFQIHIFQTTRICLHLSWQISKSVQVYRGLIYFKKGPRRFQSKGPQILGYDDVASPVNDGEALR